MPTKIRLKVHRQASKDQPAYFDTFELPLHANMNVISALLEIRKNPVNIEGKHVPPPVWDAACLEEVCGSCTMNINGRIQQACSALIEKVGVVVGDAYEVTLEPMKKFPLIRDLSVDRSRMFEDLKKVRAWVPIDGSFDLGMAPAQDDQVRHLRYALSRCMTCGCCLEACPQVSEKSEFVGPSAIGQALLFNLHPVGSTLSDERHDYLTSSEGITGCGNAQNCVKVCPKGVPLTFAIAQMNQSTTIFKLKQWMGLVGH
ncbi:MAG: succinate dehydrogenase iron-sulfur subunit [Fimbriimonadaceae bacterium]|nr:succinate dehydrogenase iron-sulfur subunit [Fimbriimonadaceae bacterium]